MFLKRHEIVAPGLGALFVAYLEVLYYPIVVVIDVSTVHLVCAIRNPYRMMGSIFRQRAQALGVVRYGPPSGGGRNSPARSVESHRFPGGLYYEWAGYRASKQRRRSGPAKLEFHASTRGIGYPQHVVQIFAGAFPPPPARYLRFRNAVPNIRKVADTTRPVGRPLLGAPMGGRR